MKNLVRIIPIVLLTMIWGCENDNNDIAEWDENNDEMIDSNEFDNMNTQVGYYEYWDTDNDGLLNENDWENGFTTYYTDVDLDENFVDWDLDGDNYIDEDEFAQNTFNMWDEDNDGYVDVDEYDVWYYPI